MLDLRAILGVTLLLLPTVAVMGTCRYLLRGNRGAGSFLLLFLAGAFSVLPVVVIDRLIYALVDLPEGGFLGPFVEAFGMAALVEEGCKFAVFASLGYLASGTIGPSRTIWAGVALASGFATVENIKFMIAFGAADIELSLLRGLLVLPAHALDGALLGYAFARARYLPRHSTRLTLLVGYLVAVTAHGLYDFMLLSDFGIGFMAFVVASAEAAIVVWGVLQLRDLERRRKNGVLVLEPEERERSALWLDAGTMRAPTVSSLLTSRSSAD